MSDDKRDPAAGTMSIELDVSDEVLGQLLAQTEAVWHALGESDPHWSVLSDERYRVDRIDAHEEGFLATGEDTLKRHLALLADSGASVAAMRSVIEYGCGVGRMTAAFARRFEVVDAYDISASHLSLAATAVEGAPGQVRLHQVRSVASLGQLPRADLVYSLLVLQHNPPPVMRVTLRYLLQAIDVGGHGLFQLPTWGEGYSFTVERYLRRPRRWWRKRQRQIEMHVLPKAEVLSLVREADCELVAIVEDGAAGPAFVSNVFVVAKPA